LFIEAQCILIRSAAAAAAATAADYEVIKYHCTRVQNRNLVSQEHGVNPGTPRKMSSSAGFYEGNCHCQINSRKYNRHLVLKSPVFDKPNNNFCDWYSKIFKVI
jgi:hypothetical protein